MKDEPFTLEEREKPNDALRNSTHLLVGAEAHKRYLSHSARMRQSSRRDK